MLMAAGFNLLVQERIQEAEAERIYLEGHLEDRQAATF